MGMRTLEREAAALEATLGGSWSSDLSVNGDRKVPSELSTIYSR